MDRVLRYECTSGGAPLREVLEHEPLHTRAEAVAHVDRRHAERWIYRTCIDAGESRHPQPAGLFDSQAAPRRVAHANILQGDGVVLGRIVLTDGHAEGG